MSSRTILITSSVFDAARCMRDLRATALAVRGHDGSLRGIVSEQDLIKRCLLKGLDARCTTVEAIMTSGVEFVTVSQARDNIAAVQRRLAELGIKHLPVVTDNEDEAGVRRCVGCLDIITVSNQVRDRAVERRGMVGRIVSSLGAMLGIQAAKAAASTAPAAHPSRLAAAAGGSSSAGAEADVSDITPLSLLMPHDSAVLDVAAAMARQQCTAIVMHDPADRASITGIVTARDVVTKILAAESSADGYEGADGLSREPVFLRAMTFDPVMALDESAELSSILEEMQRRRFRHMPVVRRLSKTSAPAPATGGGSGLVTAEPGDRVQLLYVYDFVKVTQLLLGVQPCTPMHGGAAADDAESVATAEEEDDAEEGKGGTADADAGGEDASADSSADTHERGVLRLATTPFARLSRLAESLTRARAAVSADNFASALAALRKPLIRLPRAIEAAKAAAAAAAASGDGHAGRAEAVRCRARLAVTLSLGGEASALAGVLTTACGGGDSGATSDAVSLLREAEQMMAEYARCVVIPQEWSCPASLTWGEEAGTAVPAEGELRDAVPSGWLCLPLSGTVTLMHSKPSGDGHCYDNGSAMAGSAHCSAQESVVRVSAAPIDAVARVRVTLCQQLLAAEAFEDAASIITGLAPAPLTAELLGAEAKSVGRVLSCPERRFGDEELGEMRASLTASLVSALLDRIGLAHAVLGDAALLGAILPAPVKGKFPGKRPGGAVRSFVR